MSRLTPALLIALTLGCGSAGPTLPSSAPAAEEVVGTWGLTVEAHRHTGKRYGMPANELSLNLAADGTAAWSDIPEPVWKEGAEGVLGRAEGQGRWTTSVRDGRGVVEVVDGDGGTHLVGVLGDAAPWTLALEEVGIPVAEAKRLTLTRVETGSL